MPTSISIPNELLPFVVDAFRNHADKIEAEAASGGRLWPDEEAAVRLLRHYEMRLGKG